MKNLLRCHMDVVLPNDFEGTVSDGLRLAAEYLERTPTPETVVPELVSPETLDARDELRAKYLEQSFQELMHAMASRHMIYASECCVLRIEDGEWVRKDDRLSQEEETSDSSKTSESKSLPITDQTTTPMPPTQPPSNQQSREAS